MKLTQKWSWLLLVLVLAGLGSSGCKTTAESENISSRPWNTPRGFDTGIPGFYNQGR